MKTERIQKQTSNGGSDTRTILYAVADESFNVVSSHIGSLPCGSSLKARFPALFDVSHRMSYSGRRQFALSDSLTLEYDPACRVYIVFGKDEKAARSFSSFEEEYDRAVRAEDSGRLMTDLYERIVRQRPRSYLRFASEQQLLSMIEEFMNTTAPRLRTIRHGIVCRVDGSVDEGSAVLTSRREFIFALSAMCSAVGYASRGDISIEVEHLRSEARISVSSSLRTGIAETEGAALFGPRATDAVFAVYTLRALGHRVGIKVGGGKVTFSLSARASAYHPSELKQRRARLFSMRPNSAYEQDRKHNEQLIVSPASEKDNDQTDKDYVL